MGKCILFVSVTLAVKGSEAYRGDGVTRKSFCSVKTADADGFLGFFGIPMGKHAAGTGDVAEKALRREQRCLEDRDESITSAFHSPLRMHVHRCHYQRE